jgi:hypothetical protein
MRNVDRPFQDAVKVLDGALAEAEKILAARATRLPRIEENSSFSVSLDPRTTSELMLDFHDPSDWGEFEELKGGYHLVIVRRQGEFCRSFIAILQATLEERLWASQKLADLEELVRQAEVGVYGHVLALGQQAQEYVQGLKQRTPQETP